MAGPPGLGSPFSTWSTLPEDVRREVLDLARSGRRHPDPVVRRLAWEWAEGVAGQSTWGLVLGAALTAATGAPGDLRGELRSRAEARAVVELGLPD